MQIGDPFRGKALIEVSLELVERDLVLSLQDCGAAGLASSLSEMARDVGVDVHLDRVPLREDDLEPWEIMISESQERMVAVVAPERLAEVQAVCDRWELPCTVIGEVTDHGELRAFFDDEVVGSIPAVLLTDECPRYELDTERAQRRAGPGRGGEPRAEDLGVRAVRPARRLAHRAPAGPRTQPSFESTAPAASRSRSTGRRSAAATRARPAGAR